MLCGGTLSSFDIHTPVFSCIRAGLNGYYKRPVYPRTLDALLPSVAPRRVIILPIDALARAPAHHVRHLLLGCACAVVVGVCVCVYVRVCMSTSDRLYCDK